MAGLLTSNDKRTKYCGQLDSSDIGKEVCVMGWVQRQRDLGTLIFIDLRDRTGIVQLAFDREKSGNDIFDSAFSLRAESVICAHGSVRSRGEGAVNKNMPTGEVEIFVNELKILSIAQTPPFEIVENSPVRPELRLKYRYLDLRRPDIQKNIIARSKIAKIARDFYAENGFTEIETPNLIKPTPEGARDYIVPSRVHPGSFYALPQSPQLYKQLLMLSGFDRYMQLARCFRDEDLRADRQPEFTQIDLEMSFVTQEDVIEVNERFVQRVFKDFLGVSMELPLPRMTYAEAMRRFGSDKPDIRFGFELVDLTDVVKGSEFKVFSGAVENGGSVRGINVKGGGIFSRKEIDALTETARQYRAKGLAWLKMGEETSSSYSKFLTDEENAAIAQKMELEKGDLILIVADKNKTVFDALGALRIAAAKKLGLLNPNEFKALWITEFPLFEYDEEENRYFAMHHPFTSPMDEDLEYMESNPAKVRAKAYDLVINGTEVGGGSIRIHLPEIQRQMFSAMGFSNEEVDEKFGFLIESFKYGTPPHGGIAFGFDRLVAMLLGLEDIREVIAFPKLQNASEIMTGAPSRTDTKTLNELGICIAPSENS